MDIYDLYKDCAVYSPGTESVSAAEIRAVVAYEMEVARKEEALKRQHLRKMDAFIRGEHNG